MVLELGGSDCSSDDELVVLANANWAEELTRCSTSGGVVLFLGVLLMSYSRTQPVIALSTCEAELLAIATPASEGLFVLHILSEAHIRAHLQI
eukprot:12331595-Heterocapsa_arctica.AAC.1